MRVCANKFLLLLGCQLLLQGCGLEGLVQPVAKEPGKEPPRGPPEELAPPGKGTPTRRETKLLPEDDKTKVRVSPKQEFAAAEVKAHPDVLFVFVDLAALQEVEAAGTAGNVASLDAGLPEAGDKKFAQSKAAIDRSIKAIKDMVLLPLLKPRYQYALLPTPTTTGMEDNPKTAAYLEQEAANLVAWGRNPVRDPVVEVDRADPELPTTSLSVEPTVRQSQRDLRPSRGSASKQPPPSSVVPGERVVAPTGVAGDRLDLEPLGRVPSRGHVSSEDDELARIHEGKGLATSAPATPSGSTGSGPPRLSALHAVDSVERRPSGSDSGASDLRPVGSGDEQPAPLGTLERTSGGVSAFDPFAGSEHDLADFSVVPPPSTVKDPDGEFGDLSERMREREEERLRELAEARAAMNMHVGKPGKSSLRSDIGICTGNDSRCGHNDPGKAQPMSQEHCFGCDPSDGCDCAWMSEQEMHDSVEEQWGGTPISDLRPDIRSDLMEPLLPPGSPRSSGRGSSSMHGTYVAPKLPEVTHGDSGSVDLAASSRHHYDPLPSFDEDAMLGTLDEMEPLLGSGKLSDVDGICTGHDSRCGHNAGKEQMMSQEDCFGCDPSDGCDCAWMSEQEMHDSVSRQIGGMRTFRSESHSKLVEPLLPPGSPRSSGRGSGEDSSMHGTYVAPKLPEVTHGDSGSVDLAASSRHHYVAASSTAVPDIERIEHSSPRKSTSRTHYARITGDAPSPQVGATKKDRLELDESESSSAVNLHDGIETASDSAAAYEKDLGACLAHRGPEDAVRCEVCSQTEEYFQVAESYAPQLLTECRDCSSRCREQLEASPGLDSGETVAQLEALQAFVACDVACLVGGRDQADAGLRKTREEAMCVGLEREFTATCVDNAAHECSEHADQCRLSRFVDVTYEEAEDLGYFDLEEASNPLDELSFVSMLVVMTAGHFDAVPALKHLLEEEVDEVGAEHSMGPGFHGLVPTTREFHAPEVATAATLDPPELLPPVRHASSASEHIPTARQYGHVEAGLTSPQQARQLTVPAPLSPALVDAPHTVHAPLSPVAQAGRSSGEAHGRVVDRLADMGAMVDRLVDSGASMDSGVSRVSTIDSHESHEASTVSGRLEALHDEHAPGGPWPLPRGSGAVPLYDNSGIWSQTGPLSKPSAGWSRNDGSNQAKPALNPGLSAAGLKALEGSGASKRVSESMVAQRHDSSVAGALDSDRAGEGLVAALDRRAPATVADRANGHEAEGGVCMCSYQFRHCKPDGKCYKDLSAYRGRAFGIRPANPSAGASIATCVRCNKDYTEQESTDEERIS